MKQQQETAQQRQQALETQLHARTDALSQLQAEQEQTRQQLQAATAQQQDLTAQLATQTAEVKHLQDALAQTEAQATAAQQQLETLETQKKTQEANIQTLYDQAKQQLQEAVQSDMVTLQPRPDQLMIRVGGEALFQPGQTTLRPESRRILDNVIGVLRAFPNYRIRVEGHTDSVPVGAQSRWASNWEL